MAPNLLQSFHVLTELVVQIVDEQVVILSVTNVLSSVDHPKGNFVFEGVLDHVNYAFKVRLCKFSGTKLKVDGGFLAGHDGESSADSLDSSEGKGDTLLSVYVGVQQTNHVLEGVLVGDYERLRGELAGKWGREMGKRNGKDGWIEAGMRTISLGTPATRPRVCYVQGLEGKVDRCTERENVCLQRLNIALWEEFVWNCSVKVCEY